MIRTIIAIDVDGTLYEDGSVAPQAITALRDATALGHLVVVVTGRTWTSLFDVIPDVLPLCTAAVCENGGVLVVQAPAQHTLLHRQTSSPLVAALQAAGVEPLDVGEVAIGVPTLFAPEVTQILAAAGTDEVMVHNKGSIMLLPPNCDKATGLRTALDVLGLEGSPIIAIGDAGNDLPMFEMATHPVAVSNADDAVLAAGIPRTRGIAGRGVAEAVGRLLLGRITD